MGKKRVLIVEDNPDWQRRIERYLFSVGHAGVAFAKTTAEAVSAAKRYKPDVITIDGTLADGSDGLQVAKEIRTFDPSVKILMLTGGTEIVTFEGLGFSKATFWRDKKEGFRAAVEG